jgi:CBS domain-containing protein
MYVEDLMTQRAACVRVDDNLATAAQRMWDQDCGALPVVTDDSKVVGMITDRDICMATWSRGSAPGHIRVGEAMSRDPVSCFGRDSISHAEAVLRTNQVRRVPVTDEEGHLRGILSLADLAKAADSHPIPGTRDGLSSGAVATTLATICRSSPSVLQSSDGIP